MLKLPSGPVFFACIVGGLVPFLAPDGPIRIILAVIALVGIVVAPIIEKKLREDIARADHHRKTYFDNI